jgi:hypothetical protein
MPVAFLPGGRRGPRRARLGAALATTALSTTALLSGVAALPAAARADDTAPSPGASGPAPELTAQTFADPPTSVRPKYRWWLPLADTDDQELRNELGQIADAGGGGAEVAAFPVDGAGNNTNPFLQTYGWGTPLWAQKMATALEAAKQRDLSLDFTIGPRWPATVPTVTDVNDPAAAQQLTYGSEFHAGGTSRTGSLPTNYDVARPAGANPKLLAVLAARCTNAACATQKGTRLLDQDSVVDVTSRVDGAGHLSYTFPGDRTSTYVLLAFYEVPTGQSLSGFTATGKNYVLDTLSKVGARATTDFYDSSILTPDVQHLVDQLRSVDLFEDSLELGSTEKWTSSFLDEWQARRGYSAVPLLPALAGAGDQGITSKPDFDFAGGVGARVRTDYRQTWSDLYIANRLDVLRSWAHEHHMGTRIQPYGGPIDVSAAAMHADVPEGESLAFGQSAGDYSNIEDYKVVATGAHLAGSPVVSDECCAFSGDVWGSTVGSGSDFSNLQAAYRGLAGGVNQVVWHGFPYLTRGPAGAGQQTVWPGMTYGGNTSYSEAYGSKGNPSWTDYRAVNDDVARLQLVLRQGQPRFDVAVYWQDFGMNGTGTTGTGSNSLVPDSSALAGAGYTYEYLSPDQLDSDGATFRGGELFPDTSGYHAVVLKDQRTMPVAAATKLLALARAGLPIVVVGEAPDAVPGYDADGSQDQALRATVAQLLAEPSVTRVADLAAVPQALRTSGVTAAAAHATASPAVLDVRRHTASVDYYYLFNQTGSTAAQTLTLQGTDRPYRLDSWTGKIEPIADYTSGAGTVTVPVTLAAHDATVIAVTSRRDATFHGAAPEREGGSSSGAAAQPVRLDDWSLSVDSWSPGPSDLPGDTAHTTVGPIDVRAGNDGSLPAWTGITKADGYPVDLSDTSGIGTYTTHVRLDQPWNRVTGAHLDLGGAADTVRVSVNGHPVTVDQMDLAHVDVAPYLRPGDNTVTVRVASTLLNAVRVAPGTGASGRDRMDYGLFGPVTLTPYEGADPFLTVEPVARAIPLADGGANLAEVVVTNHSGRPARVELAAASGSGITATPPAPTSVPAHAAVVMPVRVSDDGLASGSSTLTVTGRADNGATATARVVLHHSDNLALNTDEAPYPAVVATAGQDRYPAELVADGDKSTFYVSWGRAAGQGPTPADPVDVGVDLGTPVTIGSVMVGERSKYGARDYQIQVSQDGRTWQTVATVTDAPVTVGTTTRFPATTARYVRTHITRAWDNGTDANVQMDELEVHAP